MILEDLKKQVPNRYEVIELLGKGGNGIVLRAKDTVLDKVVALKLLGSQIDEKSASRFQKEAKILAKLNHPNILAALDFQLTPANEVILVLDFIDGLNLQSYVEKEGALNIDFAVSLFEGIASGISHAHANSIIHRDIKPSNIMLAKTTENKIIPKLVDFGISKMRAENKAETKVGIVYGSPLYMSPEQAQSKELSESSDIYSLGCLMYFCLSGSPPIKGESALETLTLKSTSKAPKLSEAIADFSGPERLESMIEKMLEAERSKRFTNIHEVEEELKKIKEELNGATATSSIQSIEKEESKEDNPLSQRMLPIYAIGFVLFLLAGFLLSRLLTEENKKEVTIAQKAPVKILKKEELESAMNKPLPKLKSKWRFSSGKQRIKSNGIARDDDFKELTKYKDIIWLEIPNCELTEKGVACIKDSNVQQINLESSRVTEKAIIAISKFRGLTHLNLDYINTISDTALESLTKNKSLVSLSFGHQVLTKRRLEILASIPNLRNLDIRFFESSKEPDLTLLSKSPHLHMLTVGGISLKAKNFNDLSQITKIGILEIENTDSKEIERGLTKLKNLPSLVDLIFVKLGVFPDNFGKSLAGIKSLKNLSFITCHDFDKKLVDQLKAVKTLEEVSVLNLDLQERLPAVFELARFSNLKVIHLDKTASQAVPHIKKLYPDLAIDLREF